MDALWIAALAIVMAFGVVGVVLPFIPGLPLVWGAALVYGLVGRFETEGWIAFTLITILLVVGTILGIVLPQRKVTEAGAPRSTLVAGAVSGIVGFFVIPIVGLPLGATGGVLVAEYLRTQDWKVARRSTRSLMVGFGLGALAQFAIGLMMVACWVAWVIAD